MPVVPVPEVKPVIKVDFTYKPSDLSFGIGDGTPVFYPCREVFHEHSHHINHFYFCNNRENFDDVRRFMDQCQIVAKVPKDQWVVIDDTNRKFIARVTMSEFWKYRVRRSLLTAFLRCSVNYRHENGESFVKALWSVEYTVKTKKAVEAFMDGNILFRDTKDFNGWVNFFANRPAEGRMFSKKKVRKEKDESKS